MAAAQRHGISGTTKGRAAREALARDATGSETWTKALVAIADYAGGAGGNDIKGRDSWLVSGRLDPAIRNGPGTYPRSDTVVIRVCSDPAWRATFFNPQTIAAMLQLAHRGGGDRTRAGGVGIALSPRLARRERPRPDIDQAIDLWLALAQGRAERSGTVAALEALHGAAMLLDARFQPLAMNARAVATVAHSADGALRLDRSGCLIVGTQGDAAQLLGSAPCRQRAPTRGPAISSWGGSSSGCRRAARGPR